MAVPLEIVSLSDTGLKRGSNEDSTVTDAALGLALIADGMGGYKAGEVASAIAAKAVLDEVRKHRKDPQRGTGKGKNPAKDRANRQFEVLETAIAVANKQIYGTAQELPQCEGMGTTVIVALFADQHVVVAHVGDSRLYRLRNNELRQLTADHSLVQELIDRGFFTREEAQANTPRNLVTRALGVEADVVVDIQETALEREDIYLLCSDGLNDMVDDEEIRLTLSKYSGNLAGAAQELVRLANAGGGKDNISVVIVKPQAATIAGDSGARQRIKHLLKRDSYRA